MLLAAAGNISVRTHQFGKCGLPHGHGDDWPKQEAGSESEGR